MQGDSDSSPENSCDTMPASPAAGEPSGVAEV